MYSSSYRTDGCRGATDHRLSARPAGRGLIHLLPLLLLALSGCSVPLSGIGSPDIPPEVKSADEALLSNDRAKATALFDTAVRKRRRDANVYIAIAQICELRAQWDLMARYGEQGAQNLPASEDAVRARLYGVAGVAYDHLANYAESIRVYEQAQQLAPDDPDALNGLGYAYAQAGTHLDDAIKLTSTAIGLARSSGAPAEQIGAYVDSLGWAYYKAGKVNDAVTTLASAANLAPGQMEIHYHLAVAYRARGQNSDAEIELKRALALKPKDPRIEELLRQVQADLPNRSRSQESAGQPR